MAVAERVAERATLWMPDLLGRGASTVGPDLRYSLEREVERIRDLVSALGDEMEPVGGFPTVIAGHSQGAAIAIALAAREPDIQGLVLSNPVTPWTRRPRVLNLLGAGLIRRVAAGMFWPLRRPLARAIIRRASGPRFRPRAEMIEAYAEPYAERARAETLMRVLADWRPDELLSRMPSRDLVVRVVAGGLDPRITMASAERLARELGGTLRRVPDGGHVLPEQVPGLLAREIEEVLDAVGGGAGPPRT